MTISTRVKQEPRFSRCLAGKYGHPHWERLSYICIVGSLRISAAPRADKYGHVSEETFPGAEGVKDRKSG
jgi:hypothetical protein